jgi:hypothetical protein
VFALGQDAECTLHILGAGATVHVHGWRSAADVTTVPLSWIDFMT